MAVVKNKTTQRGREFWSHVESIASQVRSGESVPIKRSTVDGSFQPDNTVERMRDRSSEAVHPEDSSSD
jgi:hypothetical protein